MTDKYKYREYNEQVRKRLLKVIELFGTTGTFISKHIGVTREMTNAFIRGEKDFKLSNIKKLDEFLKERGF